MTAEGDRTLRDVSLPAERSLQSPPAIVSRTDEYVETVRHLSDANLAYLDAQVRTAQTRETILWALFIVVFALTVAAGSAGIALIFLASLKVGIASGAAGLLPGCTGAWLRRECTIRSKNRQAIETRRDEELRLRQAVAAIAELPNGAEKKRIQMDYARKMLSRIPK
jgi:hypothetical protein